MAKPLPTISVVMATLNSMRTLPAVLEAIKKQEYPKNRLEFCFGDGGSTDGTREYIRESLGKSYKLQVTSYKRGWKFRIGDNTKLKTGEAGKAVGFRLARGKYVALIDSDNILPSRDWLKRMIEPLERDPTLIGSEPIEYTYRRSDPPLTRYCALMGLNDPLVYFLGNYDRYNTLSGKWTEAPVREVTSYKLQGKTRYRIVQLDPRNLPTIGANGTVVRRALHAKVLGKSKYLFDIDEIAKLAARGHNRFAKVEIGIIHLYAGSLSQFARKQLRRVRDYLYFQESRIRKFTWQGPPSWRRIYFVVACLTVVPLLYQSLRGYVKKPDPVWFLHPIYCWITLVVYGWGLVSYRFRPGLASRKGWKQ